jgi:hypothetical protein
MGGAPSRIEDKVRVKIYKRVTLEDLRRQALLLPALEIEIFYPITSAKPISLNFCVNCSNLERGNFLGDRSIIYVRHFDDKSLEIDGKNSLLDLAHFIVSKVKIDYGGLSTDSFLIGLSKPQHDFFYSSAFPIKGKAEPKQEEIK